MSSTGYLQTMPLDPNHRMRRLCQGAVWALATCTALVQAQTTLPTPASVRLQNPSAGYAPVQLLPDGVELGMGVDALRQALPGIAHVPRPQRLSGGLVGQWRLAPVVVAGLEGAQTFFFAGRELRRVEFVADASELADSGAAAYGELLQFGRASYGPETAANDPSGSYAAWTRGDLEVYAQRVPAPRPTVRWVVKRSEGKDASEL